MNNEQLLALVSELTAEIASLKTRVTELEESSPVDPEPAPANPFIPTPGFNQPQHVELALIYGGRR